MGGSVSLLMGSPAAARRLPRLSKGIIGSHVYWRIYITASDSVDPWKAQIGEMEYRATLGGADQAAGGTATASSTYSSFPPANGFDDDTATSWACDIDVALPQWLQYQFSSAVEVAQVAITSGITEARADRAPNDFLIQYSDDGSNWTTALSVAGEPDWGVTETRLYAI